MTPSPLVSTALLALICALSVLVRLFPVVLWGSVIHEYDPHFNYRVTKFLHAEGAYELRNWFDDRAWYPLGRSVGETVYPGLMLAAAGLHWVMETVFRLPVQVKHACVFVAPVFAALSCLSIFALTKEVTKRTTTALMAAMLLGISPAYISRSTAGSFDNEGVAIFLLVATFYAWLRAVRTGSMLSAASAAVLYFAMVISWGGYVFIINLIPLHTLAVVAMGSYSSRMYIAYSTFYPLATLMAMQVPFVGFNVILKAETAASHLVFLGLQVFALERWLRGQLSSEQLNRVFYKACAAVGGVFALGVVVAMAMGKLQWTGRSLTLLDPTYASKYIPIIASVGEHQPTAWGTFYLSLGPLMVLAPLGVYYSYQELDEGHLFMITYAAFAYYFAGVMVRLLLTLAPVACFFSATGVSGVIDKLSIMLQVSEGDDGEPEESEATPPPATPTVPPPPSTPSSGKSAKFKKTKNAEALAAARLAEAQARTEQEYQATLKYWYDLWDAFVAKTEFAPASTWAPPRSLPGGISLMLVAMVLLLIIHARQSANVARKAFSSTSMVIETWDSTTHQRTVHDDYREAYYWLRMNTEPDAKILGWWDYGYQLSSLANRTVIVDNNTWNNTHIATVGRVLGSSEVAAFPILKSLDVDYVLILFGGYAGMHGDDLDKLPWFLRISQGVFPDAAIESEFTVNGRYIHAKENATRAMTESLLYKMSYYGFFPDDEVNTTRPDLNRNEDIDARGIGFSHLEEAFTSNAWIVRIYRVKKQ
ncbi:hypothetical protein Poli38472_013440 [Pythium oligandrum]|uniref:dolichyl-diphosphooligosaccharide--protein glycotransferase n=1 Tax=Pythium oligandrum TaxID=41045 RepID=A0A8K1C7C1_PYTOL|nr:hypothetical protein Poli38472_013440 [Pythium oligandrum]|eukprot:TMW57966.1 hypothetical protein Poli38472_013440 [Pythium oligandrum]